MVRILGRCLPTMCMPRKKRQSFPICEQQTTGAKHQGEINKLFVRRVESIRVTHQGAAVKRLPLQTIAERRSEHKKTKTKSVHRNNDKLVKPDDTEFDCETHISDRESKQKNCIKSKKKSAVTKEKSALSKEKSALPKEKSALTKEKSDETIRSRSPTPLEKLFNKKKKEKAKSPAPSSVIDIPEDEQDDTTSSISSSSSISSDWSTSTYPDSRISEKSDDPIQRRQSLPVTNLPNSNYLMKHRSCVENFYLGKEHVRPPLSPPQTKTSLPKIKEEYNNKNKNSSPKQQQQQQNKQKDIKPPVKSKQVLQNVRKMIKDQSIQDQHFNDTRQKESARL